MSGRRTQLAQMAAAIAAGFLSGGLAANAREIRYADVADASLRIADEILTRLERGDFDASEPRVNGAAVMAALSRPPLDE